MLAAVSLVLFVLLLAALVTNTFRLDDTAAAWVGAGFVGLAAATFAGWAVVLRLDVGMDWAARAGGDLALVALGVLLLAAGLPTFAAGVL